MEIINSIALLQQKLSQLTNKKIGFVPTMGYLHEGHLSLVNEAIKENDIVVMSVFVNPLQFGPNEDFDTYPRDEERDAEIAKEHGVDFLFMPSVDEMYSEKRNVTMQVHDIANVLCGRSRPSHFEGVVTVLTKLFHIINPTQAYFGMKDAQQLAVIKALVDEFNFPVNIVGVNTVRESDGLAKSSRNVYLNGNERSEATSLYKSLLHGKNLIVDGIKNTDNIINKVKENLRQTSGKVDYVELLNYPNLEPIDEINETIIIAVAVRFKNARLIDNLILTKDGEIVQRIE